MVLLALYFQLVLFVIAMRQLSVNLLCGEGLVNSASFSFQTKGEALPIHNSGINDNWDDADGYYSK